jgi:hypothetical protein
MVEALEPWHTAPAIEPEFWMARGNRGRGLVRYGRSLYDDELVAIFFFYAHKDLAQAIEDAAKHPESGYAEARKYFEGTAVGRELQYLFHIDNSFGRASSG